MNTSPLVLSTVWKRSMLTHRPTNALGYSSGPARVTQPPARDADTASGKVSSRTDLEEQLSAILNARLGWRRLVPLCCMFSHP